MAELSDIAERHARILARLSELGLELAEQAAADARAGETPQARAEAIRAFHSVSRSVRQTVVLEARLTARRELVEREARAVARELAFFDTPAGGRGPGAEPFSLALAVRRQEITRAAVQRVILAEDEREDWREKLFGLLEERLAYDADSPLFHKECLDTQIAVICDQLGLSSEAAYNWRDLPGPAVAEADFDPRPEDYADGADDEFDDDEAEGEGASHPWIHRQSSA